MPWLRLYNETVSDPKIQTLDLCGKWMWITCLCVASASDIRGELRFGNVPATFRELSQVAGVGLKPGGTAIDELLARGFLQRGEGGALRVTNWDKRQRGSDVSTDRVKKYRSKTVSETDLKRAEPVSETDIRSKKLDIKNITPPMAPPKGGTRRNEHLLPSRDEVVAAYHDNCPMLPRVLVWNEKRDRMLKSRLKENAGRRELSWWVEYFQFVASSKFLTGQAEPLEGRKPFLADLEWLLSPSNMAKVIEGKYHRGEEDDDPPHYRVVGEYE